MTKKREERGFSTEMLRVCPRCGKKHPLFNREGGHNFIPSVRGDGEIESICIKCKVKQESRK